MGSNPDDPTDAPEGDFIDKQIGYNHVDLWSCEILEAFKLYKSM